ncbi:enoyl-CoA hydratase-related protein [Amycolatopsis rubida]|uniref:Enoyl-CoA hydratase/isomerase n=1 Tax=Amycolatopsis rubida TaxID=112413 RepID=A0A1I6B934_9PSEU|nr:enoyl-CoA hydratase-related protein [Amycolatopsis rubida]SFQ77307.1 Enoyl-CoA hydratase/isomerase [Amycolatopsis rubida]
MPELEYRAGTVILRFRAAARLDGAALLAALDYVGPKPVVLTGEGGRFAPASATARFSEATAAVRRHPAPVVAAINGDATGAGYALAEAADLRIMAAGVLRPPGGPAHDAETAVAAGLVDFRCPPARLLGLALRLAGAARPANAA